MQTTTSTTRTIRTRRLTLIKTLLPPTTFIKFCLDPQLTTFHLRFHLITGTNHNLTNVIEQIANDIECDLLSYTLQMDSADASHPETDFYIINAIID